MNHEANGKALHLFQDVRGGQLQYIGEATCIGHHTEVASDREGNPGKAIVFELSLGTAVSGTSPKNVHMPRDREKSSLWRQSLDSLRQLALTDAPEGATEKTRRTVVRDRSDAVRVYVLRRADGVCESCEQSAPFEAADGRPYLEPHHTCRIADGGPDHPRWVGALCPNCHAQVHHGVNGEEFNSRLIDHLGELES